VIPGASLKRPADFLLQRVKVSSDAREENVRKDEIFETLKLLIAAAARDKTIDLVVLLLSPPDNGNQHLTTLAALSRPLRDAGFLQRLRQASDAPALHALLVGA